MCRPRRNSRISGRASIHCCVEHLDPGGPGQVAVLVVRAFGQQQVHFLQRIEQREGVRMDSGVRVLAIEHGGP